MEKKERKKDRGKTVCGRCVQWKIQSKLRRERERGYQRAQQPRILLRLLKIAPNRKIVIMVFGWKFYGYVIQFVDGYNLKWPEAVINRSIAFKSYWMPKAFIWMSKRLVLKTKTVREISFSSLWPVATSIRLKWVYPISVESELLGKCQWK